MFQWTACQLIRWPQLSRPWSSPNPKHHRVLCLVQSSLILLVCKFVDKNKCQYEYVTFFTDYLFEHF